MRFQSDREREEFIRKIRDGRPILKWEEHRYWFTATYRSLRFYIYKEIREYSIENFEPHIALYRGDEYLRTNKGRFVLNRIITSESIPAWMQRSDILLFNILSGRVRLKEDDKYNDIFDSL